MTTDIEQLCKAMHRTVAAIPARFDLVLTDPMTGAEERRLPIDAARARTIIAQMIQAEEEAERRRPRRAIDELYEQRGQR